MRTKFRSMMVLILLLFATVLTLVFPKFYFSSYDYQKKQKYQINSLNLTNIYEDSNLSIDKKMELLLNEDAKRLFFQESMDKQEYEDTLQVIEAELAKIDAAVAKRFVELFCSKYDELLQVTATKIFISDADYNSLTVSQINYDSASFNITIVLDSKKHTILLLSATYFEKFEIALDIKEEDLTKQYLDYLGLHKEVPGVYGYITEQEIYLDVSSAYNDDGEKKEDNLNIKN